MDSFLKCIYSVLVAKSHKKFWSMCLVYEFSFTDVFLILIMVTEQLYWKKIMAPSILHGCGYLLPLWKGTQNDVHYTVKPVYNDHLGDKVSVVIIGRWSLQRRPVYNSQNCQ